MERDKVQKQLSKRSLSRRGFAKSVGVAALGTAVGAPLIGAAPAKAEGTLTTKEVEEHLPSSVVTGSHYAADANGNIAIGAAWPAVEPGPVGKHKAAANTAFGGAGPGIPGPLEALTTGEGNTAIGCGCLQKITTANDNTAVGESAGTALTTGWSNVLVGQAAGLAMTTGSQNTAVGDDCLMQSGGPGTGHSNVAMGCNAGGLMTSGSSNVLVGASAGYHIGSGEGNVAVGLSALASLTTVSGNTAVGYFAMAANTTGSGNVAVGYEAACHNQSGSQITAVGCFALQALTAGANNTAVGYYALGSLESGGANSALGEAAGENIVTGSNNTCVGYQAGHTDGVTATTDKSSMTLIGEQAQATVSNVIVLGKAIATRPNLIFGAAGIAERFAGGAGVFHIANVEKRPRAEAPEGGVVLFVENGKLYGLGATGEIKEIGGL